MVATMIPVSEFEVGDKVVLKNPRSTDYEGVGEVFGEVDDEGRKWHLVAFGQIYTACLAEEMQYAPVEVGKPIDCLFCGDEFTPKHGYDLCCSAQCYHDIRGEL